MSEEPKKYSLDYYRDVVARLPRPTDAECAAAALDYAETRLTEIRAQLEALADELGKPFGPAAREWPFDGDDE
jgi:hypothetical protein